MNCPNSGGRSILTFASVLLVAVPLLVHFVDIEQFGTLLHSDKSGAVPTGWEILLAVRWTALAPWNWLQLLMAGAGTGTLMLASRALSHKRNNNWAVYKRSWARNYGRMTFLKRLHFMASIGFMALALGALTLEAEETRSVLPEPVVTALQSFYARWTPSQ